MLRRRLQCKRIDGDPLLAQSQLDVAAVQQRGELPVAVTEIEHDGERVELLSVRDQKVQQETLAAAGGPENEGVTDVLNMEVVLERRSVGRLQDRDRIGKQGRSRTAVVYSEKEAEIGH